MQIVKTHIINILVEADGAWIGTPWDKDGSPA